MLFKLFFRLQCWKRGLWVNRQLFHTLSQEKSYQNERFSIVSSCSLTANHTEVTDINDLMCISKTLCWGTPHPRCVFLVCTQEAQQMQYSLCGFSPLLMRKLMILLELGKRAESQVFEWILWVNFPWGSDTIDPKDAKSTPFRNTNHTQHDSQGSKQPRLCHQLAVARPSACIHDQIYPGNLLEDKHMDSCPE